MDQPSPADAGQRVWRQGDKARLDVEIDEGPYGTHARIAVYEPGLTQRFWVPIKLLTRPA